MPALWEEGKLLDALGNVLLEKLEPVIYVDVTFTHTTYLSIVANHVHPAMDIVLPDGCGLFQQDDVLSHKAKMIQQQQAGAGGHNGMPDRCLTWLNIPGHCADIHVLDEPTVLLIYVLMWRKQC